MANRQGSTSGSNVSSQAPTQSPSVSRAWEWQAESTPIDWLLPKMFPSSWIYLRGIPSHVGSQLESVALVREKNHMLSVALIVTPMILLMQGSVANSGLAPEGVSKPAKGQS